MNVTAGSGAAAAAAAAVAAASSSSSGSLVASALTYALNSTNLTMSVPPAHYLERHSREDFYAMHRPSIPIVNRYVTPIWYVIGFPSNLVSFAVWIQPKMRPSSGCYLASLAMADFIFLILQLIFELQETWAIRILKFPVLCEGFPIIFLASQYLSPLLVLGFTVERYISICHPYKREKYCSTSRAKKVVVGLVLFSLLLHAVQGYFWTFDTVMDECTPRQAVIQGGTRSLWSVWSWITELLVFGLVPLAILVLNILVIKETRQMSRNEESRLCLRKGHKSSAATVTLLGVSFYLIFTTLPVTIFYAMYFNFPEGDPYLSDDAIRTDTTWQSHFQYYMTRIVIQELGMSHYACNFFIYVTTGKLFRRQLKLLTFRLFCKERLEEYRRADFFLDTPTRTTELHNSNSKDGQNGVAHL